MIHETNKTNTSCIKRTVRDFTRLISCCSVTLLPTQLKLRANSSFTDFGQFYRPYCSNKSRYLFTIKILSMLTPSVLHLLICYLSNDVHTERLRMNVCSNCINSQFHLKTKDNMSRLPRQKDSCFESWEVEIMQLQFLYHFHVKLSSSCV